MIDDPDYEDHILVGREAMAIWTAFDMGRGDLLLADGLIESVPPEMLRPMVAVLVGWLDSLLWTTGQLTDMPPEVIRERIAMRTLE